MFCASSAFRACCSKCCCIAGLTTRPNDQFIFWDLHWNGFLVVLLAAVVYAVPILFWILYDFVPKIALLFLGDFDMPPTGDKKPFSGGGNTLGPSGCWPWSTWRGFKKVLRNESAILGTKSRNVHRRVFFNWKYAIDEAECDLSIAYTSRSVRPFWRKIFQSQWKYANIH